jgi:uncharacterized C2H2 Zn-finger protein
MMIYCSQCGKLFRLGDIVRHWQENHGYKIYGLKDTSSKES